ncbi:MAG: PLP-dependent aminotransferase family protein [Acidobacteriia bacterium]|nr:PLP-dependent aminotransferase family protein [Terriglobia bacterium]
MAIFKGMVDHKVSVNAVKLKECFSDPLLDVMNFLNEIVMRFPEAVSFAPGRPMETHFQVEGFLENIRDFVSATAAATRVAESQVWSALGQYNRTNGTINDLIAKQLERDEGIRVFPESIMVTVGAQEAMAVLLTGLFNPSYDVLLVSDPAYIGITGLARILGIRIMPVPSGEHGLEPEKVEKAIRDCSKWGRPRALYDIPDFNNPMGTSMPLRHRHQILEVCSRAGVLLIEDNPYGMFAYDGERVPTLKALDHQNTVLYIGSFAKTLFPGLRLGYLIADQKSEGNQTLAQELSRVKSLLTVNSSPLLQAAVGGILLKHQCSLQPLVTPKLADYCRNRDVMIECLKSEFAGMEELVRWNRPGGGFFLTVYLPFPFGTEELQACSSEYGVIVCPMRFFSLMPGRESQIRLSFSYVDEKKIRAGIRRLASFVRNRMALGFTH